MLWLGRLIWLHRSSGSCWWVLGTSACHRDLWICSALSGMVCTSAHAVVSRDHETPSGLRHHTRTMKHAEVSVFLKPAAGRYPRNALGI